jgi:hypothetical protein
MYATRLLAALTLWALPIIGTGQSIPSLCPGSNSLDVSRIKTGRWTIEMVVSQNGQTQPPFQGEQEVRRITTDGKAAFQFVQVFHSPRGANTDTSIVLVDGLAPVRHRGHNSSRDLELNFAGTTVSGRTVVSGAATPFQRETAQPVFDSSILELVLAAMPLKSGFRARLPMYIHEQNGLVWHDVRVVGEESVPSDGTEVRAWQVEIKTPDFALTYLVNKQTLEPLGARASRENMSFKMSRKPAA